jgi:hypothetical protein
MAWRTAGNVGPGGGPLIPFFPPCCFKPAILEENVGDKALPGSALEVQPKRTPAAMARSISTSDRINAECDRAR